MGWIFVLFSLWLNIDALFASSSGSIWKFLLFLTGLWILILNLYVIVDWKKKKRTYVIVCCPSYIVGLIQVRLQLFSPSNIDDNKNLKFKSWISFLGIYFLGKPNKWFEGVRLRIFSVSLSHTQTPHTCFAVCSFGLVKLFRITKGFIFYYYCYYFFWINRFWLHWSLRKLNQLKFLPYNIVNLSYRFIDMGFICSFLWLYLATNRGLLFLYWMNLKRKNGVFPYFF